VFSFGSGSNFPSLDYEGMADSLLIIEDEKLLAEEMAHDPTMGHSEC
jgi:hypothetical protein